MRKMNADLDFSDIELELIGGDPFSMTVAGLRLSRLADGALRFGRQGETVR